MFDGVARRYDLTNDLLSLGLARAWRRATTNELQIYPGDRILDVAAGTGTSAVPLAKAGAQVVCADFSAGMLAQGERRHPGLEFVQADAMNLPFDDESFDATTISFGLRNVADPATALREMLRVTKPGGRLVVCEFSTPKAPGAGTLYRKVLPKAVPWVARHASSNPAAYEYLAESIADWPDQHELAELIAAAGWERVRWRNLTGGVVALHQAVKLT